MKGPQPSAWNSLLAGSRPRPASAGLAADHHGAASTVLDVCALAPPGTPRLKSLGSRVPDAGTTRRRPALRGCAWLRQIEAGCVIRRHRPFLQRAGDGSRSSGRRPVPAEPPLRPAEHGRYHCPVHPAGGAASNGGGPGAGAACTARPTDRLAQPGRRRQRRQLRQRACEGGFPARSRWSRWEPAQARSRSRPCRHLKARNKNGSPRAAGCCNPAH